MEAFIKVPTSGTVLAVDLCLCTWYSPFPIIDLGRGGGSPGLFGRGRMGRGGGVWAWRRRAKCLYSGPCCVKEQQETFCQSRLLFPLSLSHVCPCSLVGVGTLLVRVPGMGWGNNREQGGAGADGRGKAAGTWLATWGGGEKVCVVRGPASVPCVRWGGVGILGLASAQQGLIWIKPARPS